MIRSREEYQIQVALVEHFWLRRVHGAICLATANGELRDPAVGAKLKRMGVKAGTPDLWFGLPGGKSFWIELKTRTGTASPEQRDMIADLRAAGHTVYVARGLGEALAILESEGALRVSLIAETPAERPQRGRTAAKRGSPVARQGRTSPKASLEPSDAAVIRAIAAKYGVSPERVHLQAGEPARMPLDRPTLARESGLPTSASTRTRKTPAGNVTGFRAHVNENR